MGPRALKVTGALSDGTLPYLAGPTTLRTFLVPVISAAAERAGVRPPHRDGCAVATQTGLAGDQDRLRTGELLARLQREAAG